MSVQEQITALLSEAFLPKVLEVENESHMHSVPPGSESHFKVTLVSNGLNGMTKVKRHQAVYMVLADLLAGPVHALALHLYTEQEWPGTVPGSPECMGGSKHNGSA